MIQLTNTLLALTLLSVLLSLGSDRLVSLIKIMTFQGITVSLIPLTLLFQEHHGEIGAGNVLIFQAMLIIKGILIPWFLFMALKKVKMRREIEPIIGYHASTFAGLFFILMSAFIADRFFQIILNNEHVLLLITAITTLSAGLFLLMSRKKAITQVIGYLMMENGIYLLGSTLAKQTHTQYVVEFGVLLDILVAIMIMGIVLHNINSTYDGMDTGDLDSLHDLDSNRSLFHRLKG
ncbi:MAG: hydrogenase [Candidatus Electrothrix sp. AS4_5]|nr:hydrogenase [Candidatus Electrothrix gigas]